MVKETKEVVIKNGKIKEAMMGDMFKLIMEDGSEVLATRSGKMRKFKIRVLPGDTVKVEFSPTDLSRGRISQRNR